MIIPEINLEIAIASRVGAESLLISQPKRWCVISIRGPRELRSNLSSAKDSAEIVFDDVATAGAIFAPHPVHAQAIIEAAERFIGNPLLVHCAMGLSRSPAAALGILYLYARRKSLTDPVDFALNWLKELGEFKPNPRLARLIVETIDSVEHKPFDRFRKHRLWQKEETQDLYSRLLPKPKRD
jgi:predicted protein tyrosine phosphatase